MQTYTLCHLDKNKPVLIAPHIQCGRLNEKQIVTGILNNYIRQQLGGPYYISHLISPFHRIPGGKYIKASVKYEGCEYPVYYEFKLTEER